MFRTKRRRIVGYCLGHKDLPARKVGDQWSLEDDKKGDETWVLPDIATAMAVKNPKDIFGDPIPSRWTDICKVEGLARIKSLNTRYGIIWTDEPTKLIITKIIPHSVPVVPKEPSFDELLTRADRVLTTMYQKKR